MTSIAVFIVGGIAVFIVVGVTGLVFLSEIAYHLKGVHYQLHRLNERKP
jgi:hypothetical protein